MGVLTIHRGADPTRAELDVKQTLLTAFDVSCARREQNELRELASIERQLDHLLVVHHLSDGRVGGLEQWRGGLHLDAFRNGAHLQRQIDTDCHVYGHTNVIHFDRAETLSRGRNMVYPREKRGHVIRPVSCGRRRAELLIFLVRHGDLDSRDGGSTRVGHLAVH